MSKGSAPSAPDPQKTADAQIQVNQATLDQLAKTNRTNQSNPLGSSTWSQDPTTGAWTQTQAYSPEVNNQIQQQLTNTSLGLGTLGNAQQRLLNANYAGSPLDTSKLPGITSSVANPNLQTSVDTNGLPRLQTGLRGVSGDPALKQAQDAVYSQLTSRLNPQFQQGEQALRTQLTDQGIPQNSEAWNKAMDDFNRQKTDAYNTASNTAVGTGNALQSQLYGQGLSTGQFTNSAQGQAFQQLLQKAGFTNAALGQQFGQNMGNAQLGNTANAQALAQMLTQRQEPINEINSIRSGNAMTPAFGAGESNLNPAGAAPNMGQLYGQNYAGQLNSYNANTGANTSLLGSLLGLGAAGLMGSSRAIKDTIEPIAPGSALAVVKSLPVDRWRYKGETIVHVGPYAEDFTEATGLGDGMSISIIDMLGVLTGAIKDLAAKVERLEERKAA